MSKPKDEFLSKALAHRQQPSAGTMQDRRNKRARTRQADKARAVRENGA